MTIVSSYFICATPRSGSTLLCELLTLTGVAGHPSEWMLPLTEPLARDMFGVEPAFSHPSYLAELKAKACTGNGLFAAKLMWPSMQQLLAGELWGLPPAQVPLREAGVFPHLRYVHIVRRDKSRQAISPLLALRTDYWQRMAQAPAARSASAWAEAALRLDARADHPRIFTEGAAPRWPVEEIARELEDPQRRAALMAQIDAHATMIRHQEAAWADFFRRDGVTPFAFPTRIWSPNLPRSHATCCSSSAWPLSARRISTRSASVR
jgi:LPS sulfotransferase NodH